MVKQRIVEIDILETTTDEHFERILSLIRILEGTCEAREIKPTDEKIKNEFFNGEGVDLK